MGDATDFETPITEAPWINFKNAGDPGLDVVAAREGFHPLEVEDCRHRNQIAKISEHEEYTFIVIKTIRFDRETFELEFDDFDLFVKPQRLVTVEEQNGCNVIDRA